MVDGRAASVIMPRSDFATFLQMQPNGLACNQQPNCTVEIRLSRSSH